MPISNEQQQEEAVFHLQALWEGASQEKSGLVVTPLKAQAEVKVSDLQVCAFWLLQVPLLVWLCLQLSSHLGISDYLETLPYA